MAKHPIRSHHTHFIACLYGYNNLNKDGFNFKSRFLPTEFESVDVAMQKFRGKLYASAGRYTVCQVEPKSLSLNEQ